MSRQGRRRTNALPRLGSLEFAWRPVRGGKRIVMDELAPRAVAFEPRLKRAVDKWRSLSEWRRRFVTLDDLAAEAGLAPGAFFGAVTRASFELTAQMTDLIVVNAFPAAVAAAAKRARTPHGIADRQLLFEHMNALRDARTYEPDHPAPTKPAGDRVSSNRLAFLKTGDGDDTTH